MAAREDYLSLCFDSGQKEEAVLLRTDAAQGISTPI